MQIQNTTNDPVVYEAKDGGPGAGDTPLTSVTTQPKICNGTGCAGNLSSMNPLVVNEVDTFGTVHIRIYKPGAVQESQLLHEAFTRNPEKCLFEIFQVGTDTRLRHVSLI